MRQVGRDRHHRDAGLREAIDRGHDLRRVGGTEDDAVAARAANTVQRLGHRGGGLHLPQMEA